MFLDLCRISQNICRNLARPQSALQHSEGRSGRQLRPPLAARTPASTHGIHPLPMGSSVDISVGGRAGAPASAALATVQAFREV